MTESQIVLLALTGFGLWWVYSVGQSIGENRQTNYIKWLEGTANFWRQSCSDAQRDLERAEQAIERGETWNYERRG